MESPGLTAIGCEECLRLLPGDEIGRSMWLVPHRLTGRRPDRSPAR